MAKTKIKFHSEARKAILKGANIIYDAVKMSLGPEGGNALMYGTFGRSPRITNDGVSIAKSIELNDEFESLAANSFREAAEKTNQKAGDGTTTTIVIAGKLLNDVFGKLSETSSAIRTATSGGKAGVMSLSRQLLASAKVVIEKIKGVAVEIKSLEDLEKIASVSVEDANLGKIIANMAYEVGIDGFIDTIEGHKGVIETEIIKGARFPAKIAAKAFVNNQARYEMICEELPVVVTNRKLTNPSQIGSFTKNLHTNKLVVFAPEFSESVLVDLVMAFKNGFQIFPVKVPALRTEQFEDLCVYTGAKFINKDAGIALETITDKDLGWLDKLVVKDIDAREDAVLTGGGGTKEGRTNLTGIELKTDSEVAKRIKILLSQVDEERIDSHKKLLQRRIASLGSAIGVIRVGASTDKESHYKKMKIEDAVYACKAALQEGYVKGGGLCLKEIAETLPDGDLLKPALLAPYNQIQANSEETLVIGDEIVDPAKSTRLSVEHAVSIVAQLITVKVCIPQANEINPGDGSAMIAKAIMNYTRLLQKKEGLINENLAEAEGEQDRIYQERLMGDDY